LKKRPDGSSAERNSGLPDEKIRQAVQVLRRGGIVAFPTETYYGLAVDPGNEAALQRLFQIKNRPAGKPLLLLVHDISLLDGLVSAVPDVYLPLIGKYWPGPLTLIFPAQPHLSAWLTGGTGTVGVRISPRPEARALARIFGKAVTATSANLSDQPPARFAFEVSDSFGSAVDFILDGGKTPGGRCSTVIGLRDGRLCLLRPGAITVEGVEF
jgi:L-threonylcarbamoyladenylate synthase